MNRISLLYLLAVPICSITVPVFCVHAENSVQSAADAVHIMPEVTVSGTQNDTMTSSETVDSELKHKLPTQNGTISELLETLPGVQLPENSESSKTGGEIKPLELSISGGRTADNNYIFDGASISSSLDPDFTNINNIENIPGHSQRVFLLEHLVEDITVLKANIPAKYGDFTGGVVEIESIDPEPEFSGEISYRTTRSVWGKFHLDEEDEEEFYESTTPENQPRFKKHETSLTIHAPINLDMGFVFDYSRLESSIPLLNLETPKTQRRKNENYFVKFVATPEIDKKIHLSATYAPYVEEHFRENTLNSDYQLKGGGYIFDAGIEQEIDSGKLDFSINYQHSQNSREAENTLYRWRETPSKDWGDRYSYDGGYGDLEKLEKSISANFDFSLKELKTGSIKHKLNVGAETSYLEGTFDRTEEFTDYFGWLADGSSAIYPVIPCPAGDPFCVDGEQFIFYKNVRPANTAGADIFKVQTYIEDQLEIDRLSLRPGLRISYQNYQNNLNLAPRFAAAYDLFGNQKTIVNTGYNRYYGTNLLTLELASQQAISKRYYRCIDKDDNGICDNDESPKYSPNYDWIERPPTNITSGRVSDLKTPFSDEITLGINQKFLGSQLDLLYIEREYKDQVIAVTLDKENIDGVDYKFREWRNDGRRSYKEFSLAWQKSWKNHFVSINFTWQDTESNSSSYNDTFSEHQLDDEVDELDLPVWYEGKLTDKSNVPISDYNRPYTVGVIYSLELPYGFSFTNVTNYKRHYLRTEKITSGDVIMPDGSIVDARDLENDFYDEVYKPSELTFDWKLLWGSPEWNQNQLMLSFDIYNVFNKKVEIGTVDGEYKLGRQFWAGLTYKF